MQRSQKDVEYDFDGRTSDSAGVREQSEAEAELTAAFAREEFEVWYQPQVDMRTGAIFGAEALVRWRHPRRGLLLPASFLPALERRGLMPAVDQEVLRLVCKDAKEAKRSGIPFGPVSVNLSRLHAGRGEMRCAEEYAGSLCPDFLGEDAADRNELLFDRNELLFELTETAREKEEDQEIRQFARKLQDEGFRIAMDDYGMGSSTLKMLCQIPFDILKLDRYFVNRIGDAKSETILRSTISMAKELGMEVVAEGVERRRQIGFLLEAGCRLAQGYYYARPLRKARYLRYRQEDRHLPEVRK